MKILAIAVDDVVYSFVGKERDCDEKKKRRGIEKNSRAGRWKSRQREDPEQSVKRGDQTKLTDCS